MTVYLLYVDDPIYSGDTTLPRGVFTDEATAWEAVRRFSAWPRRKTYLWAWNTLTQERKEIL